jgi:FixJ family two-component response regulator
VLFADTCDQARAALDQLKAPVILYDRDLAGGDWREVVQALASSPHRTCVILISRVVDDYLWNEVAQKGGYDVLLKPLREEDVVRAVRLAWSYWNTTRRVSVFPASDRHAGRVRK